ncbi:hypothetical protein AB0M92_07205 [Streptomyces sp. NPDC051582]|uniref:hypothetical protein n=1 Tax=Streptomyces sp. NPDC051582 TaxID=3155167 RepID=UPI00344AB740
MRLTDPYDIRQRAEALRQVDLPAGFLATRYPDDPDIRRELAVCAECGRHGRRTRPSACGAPGDGAVA